MAGRQQQLEDKKEVKRREVEEKRYYDAMVEEDRQARLQKGTSGLVCLFEYLFSRRVGDSRKGKGNEAEHY